MPRKAKLSFVPKPEAKAARSPAKKKSAKATPTEQDIRYRAYEIYNERGRYPGRALDDWLQAEREIKGVVASIVANVADIAARSPRKKARAKLHD